jgi:hypothetical protein
MQRVDGAICLHRRGKAVPPQKDRRRRAEINAFFRVGLLL